MAPIAVEPQSPPTPAAVSGKRVDPTPRVDYFDAASATTEQLKSSLARNGAFIIRNLVSQEDMGKVVEDVRPHFEDDTPWEGVCFPPQTRRFSGIVAKSDTFRHKVVMNKAWLDLCNEVLSITNAAWFGDVCAESTSKPILGVTVCFRVSPGAEGQGLHRDSMPHHVNNPACTVDEYNFSRDVALNMFIAGTKTTKENGATRFVPGSHLGKSTEKGNEEDAVYAEMEPGDAMIMLSSVYHGGSANMSKDEDRLVFTAFMNRGTMRTVSLAESSIFDLRKLKNADRQYSKGENLYLTIPPEQAAKWSDEELEVCGYAMSHPFLGMVNFVDPMVAIRGQKEGKRYDITDAKVVSS
ncbi:hypothetical protein ACLMJK_000856 [Lecanora helva]